MEPVVWRGPGSVQLGLGGEGRVLSGLTDAEVTLLMRPGEPSRAELSRHGVRMARWKELAAWRAEAGSLSQEGEFSPGGAEETGWAAGSLPALIALDHSSLTRAVVSAAERARGPHPAAGRPVHVLTDGWVTDPIRVRPLLARDLPHLPLTVDSVGLTVGPLVIPGVTACTRCLDLHRTEADSAWPTAATQLRITRAPAATAALTAVAASLALFTLRPGAPGWRVEPGRVGEVRVAPHPECGCLTPPSGDGPGRA